MTFQFQEQERKSGIMKNGSTPKKMATLLYISEYFFCLFFTDILTKW